MTATEGLARSIHTRLVALSKEMGLEAQFLLERYALHRLLYRLSTSRHADRFLLKGAQLMLIWVGESARATRDADLLGFGELSDEALTSIFTELCAIEAAEDGVVYQADTIRIQPIREETAYGGRRVQLLAQLGSARLRVQVDVGIGDAVTPEPEWVDLPPMLDLPTARLRAYRPETSIAEKLETILARGLLNSRLKDYLDVYVLSQREAFDRATLSEAVRATLVRRGTAIPDKAPAGLTRAFVKEPGKAAQWRSLLQKANVSGVSDDLGVVVGAVARFLEPVLESVHRGVTEPGTWPPGGPWREKEDG